HTRCLSDWSSDVCSSDLETLSELDAAARRDLRWRIAGLAAAGVAVLMASRDPAALERLAARVLILREGRIVRAGPLPELVGEREIGRASCRERGRTAVGA